MMLVEAVVPAEVFWRLVAQSAIGMVEQTVKLAQGLKKRLALAERNKKQAEECRNMWYGIALAREHALESLASAVADVAWFDLFHQEGERIDALIAGDQYTQAVVEVADALGLHPTAAKPLVDARRAILGT
ncbi:MAG: hypothetical protein GWN58_36505 [Anaerolineae bacterium]|nr:hypothetical protein [Anaerolineae bacterium]